MIRSLNKHHNVGKLLVTYNNIKDISYLFLYNCYTDINVRVHYEKYEDHGDNRLTIMIITKIMKTTECLIN